MYQTAAGMRIKKMESVNSGSIAIAASVSHAGKQDGNHGGGASPHRDGGHREKGRRRRRGLAVERGQEAAVPGRATSRRVPPGEHRPDGLPHVRRPPWRARARRRLRRHLLRLGHRLKRPGKHSYPRVSFGQLASSTAAALLNTPLR